MRSNQKTVFIAEFFDQLHPLLSFRIKKMKIPRKMLPAAQNPSVSNLKK